MLGGNTFYSNNSQSAKFSHVQWCVKNNFRKDDRAIETNYKSDSDS